MDAWLQPFVAEPLGRLVLGSAMSQFYAFTLVLVRMSGLMVIGPLFGQSTIPINVRVLLAIALSLLLTPLVADRHQLGFDRLDTNADGLLAPDEIPPGLAPRFERLLAEAGRRDGLPLRRADDRARLVLPESLGDYARIAAGEVVLGLLLGVGVMTVLGGLQIAGQLIDQQSGLGLGEIFNPNLGGSVSLTGQTLVWLGTVAFLLLSPLGGHLLMIRILAETFETMPVGEAVVSFSSAELLNLLVRQSLLLGLRVAAPVMVMMSLVDLTFGFLNHSVPQINIQAVGFTLRALLGLLLLAVTLTGVPDVVAAALLDSLETLRDAIVFPA
jgi:flagellar biosynthetic protein FliR